MLTKERLIEERPSVGRRERRTLLLLTALMGATPLTTHAQTVDAAPPAPPRAVAGATPVNHRDTLKTFFVRHDLEVSGIALAGTVIVSHFDLRIEHYFQSAGVQGSTSRRNLVNDLTRVNETTLTEASILAYGISRFSHSSTFADVALHTAESVVLTSVISQVIRGPIGRERPSVSPDGQYQFQFGRGFFQFNNRSFPSLHSSTAFAAAASLAGEIHDRDPGASWYANPLLYGAAMVPGLTRMYLNQHWASDVVSGAFLGTLIGSRVVSYAHTHNRSKLDRFLLGTVVAPDPRGGGTVGFSFRP